MTQLYVKEGGRCRVSFPLATLSVAYDPSNQEISGFRKIQGEARWKTLVVVWPTHPSGNPQWGFRGDWKVHTLILGEYAFEKLRNIHREWSLGKHDVMLDGKAEPDNFFYTPCRISLFRKILAENPQVAEKLMSRITEFLPEEPLCWPEDMAAVRAPAQEALMSMYADLDKQAKNTDLLKPISEGPGSKGQFQLKEGETCRVSFPLIPLAGDTPIAPGRLPGFRKLPGGGWKTLVVVWPTDAHGAIDKETAKTDWRIQSAVLHPSLFDDLCRLHREWDLKQIDVKILCTSLHSTPDWEWPVWRANPCRLNLFSICLQGTSEKAKAFKEKVMAKLTEFLPEPPEIPKDLKATGPSVQLTPISPKDFTVSGEFFVGVDMGEGPDKTGVMVIKQDEWTAEQTRAKASFLNTLREQLPSWDWRALEPFGAYIRLQGVRGNLVLEAEANQSLAWDFSLCKGPLPRYRHQRQAFKGQDTGKGSAQLPQALRAFLDAARALMEEAARDCGAMRGYSECP